MNGYVVALDRCYRNSTTQKFEWESDRSLVKGAPSSFFHPIYEHYYWDGTRKTWFGAVEEAPVYATVEDAESSALIAVALDADVVGHVKVVDAETAYHREKEGIARRAAAKEQKKAWDASRFKLRPGEGGGV